MTDDADSSLEVNPVLHKTDSPLPANMGGGPPEPPAAPQNLRPSVSRWRRMPGSVRKGLIGGCLGVFLVLTVIAVSLAFKIREALQRERCWQNFYQIGDAVRTWAGKHNGNMPFNVSTNQGGTMELCSFGPDGFDRNSWLQFRALSNELDSPRILVCPGDAMKHPATDFQHLQAGNVSYVIVSATNVSDAHPVDLLVYCPIHHLVLLTDGHVAHLTADEARQRLSTPAR